MTFKQFLKELNGNRVEGELLLTLFLSLLTSVIFLGVLYLFKFRYIENFIPKYGFSLLFVMLGFAIVLPAIRQIRAYKHFPCMSGMMIGMTVGMISSFLPGYYIAMTNGMFYGGFFGILVGALLGIWMGYTCGIMGMMEGIMAGFMGGLMGAMTAFMLLNDHLKLAGILVFVICAIIIVKLNYMVYVETKERERVRKESQLFTIIVTLILMALSTWLIVFGARSVLFQ